MEETKASLAFRANYLEIFNKNYKLACKVETIRLSGWSDRYEPGNALCYIIVYTMGSFPTKEKLGINIYPGYVVVFEQETINRSCKAGGLYYEYQKVMGNTPGQSHGPMLIHFMLHVM